MKPRQLSVAVVLGYGFCLLLLLLGTFFTALGGGIEVQFLYDSLFWHQVWFTYVQAFLSATFALVLGLFCALSLRGTVFSVVGERLGLVCFALPGILVALMFAGAFVSFGTFLFGWIGILMAHVFLNFPLFLFYSGRALRELSDADERAAISLGASHLRVWWSFTVPKLLPTLRFAFAISFLLCSTSFAIPMILGGTPYFNTLEVAIYHAVKFDWNLGRASCLAGMQLLIGLLVYSLLWRREVGDLGRKPVQASATALVAPTAFRVTALLVGFLALVPFVFLFRKGVVGLTQLSFEEVLPHVLSSLILAGISVVVTLTVALCLAYTRKYSSSGMGLVTTWAAGMPVSISTLILSLGIILFVPRVMGDRVLWFLLVGSVQGLVQVPYAYRSLCEAFDRITGSQYRASISLGAGPWWTLALVELPLLRSALMGSAVLSFVFSLGDVGAVVLFPGKGAAPLSSWIFQLMSQYQFASAYGAALCLVVVMGIPVLGAARAKL